MSNLINALPPLRKSIFSEAFIDEDDAPEPAENAPEPPVEIACVPPMNELLASFQTRRAEETAKIARLERLLEEATRVLKSLDRA